MATQLARVPTNGSEPQRQSRPRGVVRWLVRAVVLLVVLGLVVVFAASWYFSGEVRDGISAESLDLEDNVRVAAVAPGEVTLEPIGSELTALDEDTVYGLDWGEGHGQVSGVVVEDGTSVTRVLEVLAGAAPEVADTARFTKDAYPWQAGRALDVPVRQVAVAGADGALPAWFASGEGTTWAILTHGRGATRSELFRLMRVTTDLGFPSLNISYRNDPENGGGLARFGQVEWPDLEAAVRYALDHGARRVVLLGCSMGGAITAAFVENSPLADRVGAVALDAPMLDFAATIAHRADRRTVPGLGTPIPGFVVWGALQLAGLRFDIDLDAVDYLDDTSWVTQPVLVIHGTEDRTVPVAVTERLAEARPALVEEHLVEGAGHVESWNVDPARYDAWVADFLTPYAP